MFQLAFLTVACVEEDPKPLQQFSTVQRLLILVFLLFFSEHCSLSAVVSEAFVRFFVEIVGHYPLFMGGNERDEESSASSSSSPTPLSFQREAFRKAVSSKSLRRFLEVFMETQMFAGFVQERELRRQGLRGVY